MSKFPQNKVPAAGLIQDLATDAIELVDEEQLQQLDDLPEIVDDEFEIAEEVDDEVPEHIPQHIADDFVHSTDDLDDEALTEQLDQVEQDDSSITEDIEELDGIQGKDDYVVNVTAEEADVQVRATVDDAIEWCLEEENRVAFVNVWPPGAGKTRAAIRSALAKFETATICAPSHKLIDEMINTFKEAVDDEGTDVGDRAYHYKSAMHQIDNNKLYKEWGERGWPILNWLRKAHLLEDDHVALPSSDSFIFMPHAALSPCASNDLTATCDAVKYVRDPVIIDELPNLVVTTVITQSDIMMVTTNPSNYEALATWYKKRAPIAQLIIDTMKVLRDSPDRPGGIWPARQFRQNLSDACKIAAGGTEPLADLLAAFQVAHTASPYPPTPPLAAVINKSLAPDIWPRINIDEIMLDFVEGRATKDTIINIVMAGKKENTAFWIERRQVWPQIFLPRGHSYVVLDATAGMMTKSIEAAFTDPFKVESFNLRVNGSEDHAKMFVVHGDTMAAQKLRRPALVPAMTEQAIEMLCARITALDLLKEVGKSKPSLAIIGHKIVIKFLEDEDASFNIRKILSKFFAVTIQLGHYHNVRGLNEFEKCDVLFMLGDPRPDWGSAQSEADLLDVDPSIHMDGLVRSETEQVIHRLRPLRAKTMKLIGFIGSGRPFYWLEGVQKITTQSVQLSPTSSKPMSKLHGNAKKSVGNMDIWVVSMLDRYGFVHAKPPEAVLQPFFGGLKAQEDALVADLSTSKLLINPQVMQNGSSTFSATCEGADTSSFFPSKTAFPAKKPKNHATLDKSNIFRRLVKVAQNLQLLRFSAPRILCSVDQTKTPKELAAKIKLNKTKPPKGRAWSYYAKEELSEEALTHSLMDILNRLNKKEDNNGGHGGGGWL